MDELLDGYLTGMADAIRNKQVKCTDLVRAWLDRIEQVNPALNAVVHSTAELAMKYAAKYDSELANGQLRGALHGVPMTIKDSLDTRDAITTWGTEGRREFQPGADATCVKRLKDAGCILLGKTNTPEFTLAFQTDNLVYGRTNNPFDITRTPGGSSGGAAAIIAAGASPFDIGTDTGGSIRLPAHFCGIAGIKPTTGRVPCTGNALPSSGLIAPLSQPGPLARNVTDLETILNVIQGPDLIDPYCVDATLGASADVDVSALRIGFHADNGIARPDAAIEAAIRLACDVLNGDGIATTEARPSGVEMASFIMGRVMGADAGALVEDLIADCHTERASPRIQMTLDRDPPRIDAQEFARIITLWDNYRSTMLEYFERFDILICPVNGHTAIRHGDEEDMAAYSYTMAYNLTGWPGVVIRAGTDDAGLPVGIQILAKPYREDHCLAVARYLEARLGDFSRPDVYVSNHQPESGVQ